jgi:hypothetical protein
VLKGAGMSKQRLDGLAVFRMVVGAWLVLAPWLLPGSTTMHRLSGLASGAAVIAVGFYSERVPSLRFLQGLAGAWVMASSALLEPGPIMINSIVIGLVVLVSAVVTRETFTP